MMWLDGSRLMSVLAGLVVICDWYRLRFHGVKVRPLGAIYDATIWALMGASGASLGLALFVADRLQVQGQVQIPFIFDLVRIWAWAIFAIALGVRASVRFEGGLYIRIALAIVMLGGALAGYLDRIP